MMVSIAMVGFGWRPIAMMGLVDGLRRRRRGRRVAITMVRLVGSMALAVGYISHIARIAINVVLDMLGATIRKEDVVSTLSLLAIPVFIVSKVNMAMVLVLGIDLVTILVMGRLVVVMSIAMVRLMVLC